MWWFEENWPLLLKIVAALATIIILIMFGIYIWENRVFFGLLLLGLAVLYALAHDRRQRGETTAVIFSDFPALFVYFVLLFTVWKQVQERFPMLKPDAQKEREQQEVHGSDERDRRFHDFELEKK